MPLDVTRTIASVGSWMTGSSTQSTRTSRFPCQVTAFTRPRCPGRASAKPSRRNDFRRWHNASSAHDGGSAKDGRATSSQELRTAVEQQNYGASCHQNVDNLFHQIDVSRLTWKHVAQGG